MLAAYRKASADAVVASASFWNRRFLPGQTKLDTSNNHHDRRFFGEPMALGVLLTAP